MRTNQIRNLSVFVTCLAILVPSMASAQSVKHDFMDIAAARRDIHRLQIDRARAVSYGNWSKVAQDDRLIRSDRFWIQRDRNKVHRAGD